MFCFTICRSLQFFRAVKYVIENSSFFALYCFREGTLYITIEPKIGFTWYIYIFFCFFIFSIVEHIYKTDIRAYVSERMKSHSIRNKKKTKSLMFRFTCNFVLRRVINAIRKKKISFILGAFCNKRHSSKSSFIAHCIKFNEKNWHYFQQRIK